MWYDVEGCKGLVEKLFLCWPIIVLEMFIPVDLGIVFKALAK